MVLGVSAGRSGGWIFGWPGLGLLVIMLESRHRKWQGASVSDFGGWFNGVTTSPGWVFSATVRWPFDGAQDERTGGLGVVRRATMSGGC